jgi:rhomboid family GlyGly-CTERM serine protease
MDPEVKTIEPNDLGPFKKAFIHIDRNRSIWTWVAVLLAVNLPLIWGEVRAELIFFPDAVDGGQWWRVVTFPLVHLSWYHLLLDGIGFLLLFSCLEEKRGTAKALYILGAGAGTLLLSLALGPSVFQRGLSGLSGVAHGLMAISAVEMVGNRAQRNWGLVSLAAVVAKSAYELWSGQVAFDFLHMGLCGQPIAASHAGGVAGGLFIYALINAPLAGHRVDHPRKRRRGPYLLKERPLSHRFQRRATRLLARIMYRIRYEGLERIPAKGPAVLICNHVSYVDWLLIASACNRPVHFVMHASIYRMPIFRWILPTAQVIPIESGRKDPAALRQALDRIADLLQAGRLVCLFPEGRLTRTGKMDPFRPGIERIVQRTPVPVIPLAIRGLWGSFFSHKGGPAMRRWPKLIRRRIELATGRAIPSHHATVGHLRQVVARLHGAKLGANLLKPSPPIKPGGSRRRASVRTVTGAAIIAMLTLFGGVSLHSRITPEPLLKRNECVILVHGLFRSSLSMKLLERELKHNGYAVLNLDYGSTQNSITDIALNDTAKAVETCRRLGYERVHFVTHSMGAIVVRRYLQANQVPAGSRIVMLAPPNQGSELMDWVVRRFPRLTRLIGPGACELQTNAQTLLARLRPISAEIGIIIGSTSWNPYFSSILPGADDGKVTVARAKLAEMSDFLIAECNHTTILIKPDIQRQVVNFLENGRFARGE